MTFVLFLRMTVEKDIDIGARLATFYADGWRVVSHAEAGGEYSFVLERKGPS